MKRFSKTALGVLALVGSTLTLATTTPAEARVSVGIGLGVPGPVYYDRTYYGDPCASPRFRYYHPGYCGYPGYYYSGYYDPAWVNGFWVTDSFGHRRWHDGRRNSGWRR
jgi:hypothetical protein